MLRSQILLTPEITEEIHKLSDRQGLSFSEATRILLAQALGMKDGRTGIEETNKSLKQIYDLGEYKEKNQRIDGFKEVYSVGGRTSEMKIVGDEVFREYLTERRLPSDFEYKLLKAANQLREASPLKTLVVRRAYVVPGLENPPGPRFLGLKVAEVVKAIKNIYDFAIEHDYYLREGSQIAVMLLPFVDPKPLTLPIKIGTALPYGGYAAPLNNESSRVEVYAVWGNNEGVQSFDAIDRYTVDSDRAIILNKDVPQKNLMLCTTKKSQSDKIKVPVDRQFEQVLNDGEILEVARVVKEASKKYGLRRVEFSFNGVDNIVFNESARYEINDQQVTDFDKRGFVKTVSTAKDVEEVKKMTVEESERTIVYIDKKIVENRAYDLLNNIAGLPTKFTVLYPGLSATAHAMRVLNDFGHRAITVGNRVFAEGEEVLVKVNDGQVMVEQLSDNGKNSYVLNLYDARLFGLEMVGGKANNLSILKTKGFNVPHGWVVTTKFFDDKKWALFNSLINLDKKKLYAVRSSATVEDQLEHSFAGQFETYLGVKPEDVKKKVMKVMECIKNKQVETYVKALGRTESMKMAVVVQEMVDVVKSGVVFGKDIQTDNEDNMVIDVAMGIGEGVVDGTAKTHRVIYSRNKNKIISQSTLEKLYLDKVEINALIEMAYSIERLMGRTQDIEWALDKKGGMWLVQTRDL